MTVITCSIILMLVLSLLYYAHAFIIVSSKVLKMVSVIISLNQQNAGLYIVFRLYSQLHNLHVYIILMFHVSFIKLTFPSHVMVISADENIP